MNPKNQTTRTKAAGPDNTTGGGRTSSLPAIQQRNSANPARRNKSIGAGGASARGKNTQVLRNSQRAGSGAARHSTLEDEHNYE